ncbi:MAG: alanine racemase [Ruminococcus sp.]|nr:alanine racemase [Ruminococcus sp.]
MEIVKRTWTEISLDYARDNFLEIKKKVGQKKLCCVVKADGYGHGAVALAELYEKLGASYFAVSNLDEGKELRDGGIKAPILILGYTPASCADELSSLDISQAVYSLDYARLLSESCKASGVSVNIHIKLDTGMSRIGFMCQEFPRDDNSIEEIKTACALEGLNPQGIFTHFCVSDCAEDGREFTEKQFNAFTHTVNSLKENNINFETVHCSNSGAIEDYPQTYCDMVRAGIILYGLAPSPELKDRLTLKPCMTMKTVVSHVKPLRKGATISYGRTFTAERDMIVATVPVGYADGFIRAYAQDGYMIVKGKKAPIVGRICMDQAMLDVSDIEGVEIGDEVIVFGSGENGERTADDLALCARTINYEVVCAISKRVPRIYLRRDKILEVMYKI